MIAVGAELIGGWIPVERLVVRQVEPRNPERVAFYHALLMANPDRHCGPPIAVTPLDGGYYEILDGHHRYLAHVLAGRAIIPAVIIIGDEHA